ncbi:MAG: RNA polymerase sigma factor [Candidatus Hinthialibacter sp.]
MNDSMMAPIDPSVLFLRYREEGDTSAFQTLMDQLHVPIYNYLLRLLRNRDDAEDALQEVWFKAIRQRDRYNEQGQFTSWIYRIAHNHCIDIFRRRGRRIEEYEQKSGEEGNMLDRIAAADPSPRETLSEKEQMAALEEAVAQLPEAIREVYILRAIHDIPFKEIAEIQNSPLGTVLSRMHQAVRFLKSYIQDSQKSALSEEISA